MSISIHDVVVPAFIGGLTSLAAVLRKGAAFAQEKGVDPERLLQQRLIFDMFPLLKQVQIACDTAARSTARLAGVEPKPFPDTETSLAEAEDRIRNTIAYLQTFTADQFTGREDADIVHKTRGGETHFKGIDYVNRYALPNFFFHCTTAYDILRVAGAPVGKRDFLGV